MAMRAMGVNGEDGCPKIEPDAVEYFFHCVSGNGPDSGWLAKPCWQSPKVADGKYAYLSTGAKDFAAKDPKDDQMMMIVDLQDPKAPKEAGRWWLPPSR